MCFITFGRNAERFFCYEKQKAGGYLATASRLQGIFTLKTTNPNLNKWIQKVVSIKIFAIFVGINLL